MPRFAQYTDESAPYQLRFTAYGVTMTVCASTANLLARAEAFMPPGWKPAPAPPSPPDNGYELGIVTGNDGYRLGILAEEDGSYSIYSGSTRISEGQVLEHSLIVLDGQIRVHLAAHAPELTFAHAGVVAHNEKALILPGYSFAGKTTLVAALVQKGAVYYSDEFAVLDDRGLVHPYAKPLSLRRPDGSQVDRDVESLGGVAGLEPVAIGLAAAAYYEPGAHWNPRRLSAGESALALLSHTVSIRTRPDTAIKVVRRALDGVVTLEGKRGEADETAEILLQALASGG